MRPLARWTSIGLDLGLSALALLAWEVRFGALGPDFNSDVAIHGAMILRPVDQSFVYYWGQGRLGSVVPLVGKLLHALLPLGAAECAQLAVYLCCALALLLALGMLRGLAPKVLLFAFFAFPSTILAESVLTPGQHATGLLLLSVIEVRVLLRFLRAPGTMSVGVFGLAAGLMIWAAESGVFVLLAQVPILIVAGRRLSRDRRLQFAGAAVLGVIPPAMLVLYGKQLGPRSAEYHHLLHAREVARNLAHLAVSLRPLVPALGGVALMLLAVIAAAAAIRSLRQLNRTEPEPLAAIGLAPLCGYIGVAASRYFELNDHAPRYLSCFAVLGWLSLTILLDTFLERATTGSTSPWRVRLIRAGALPLSVWLAVTGFRSDDRFRPAGPRWREREAWIEHIGCPAVVGSYWNSYPYFTLSDGRVLATPHEGDFVRQPALAEEALAAPLVCVIPWWGEGACPATLSQFGHELVIQDELTGPVVPAAHPYEHPLRACLFRPHKPGS
jgi:hypothetical protein